MKKIIIISVFILCSCSPVIHLGAGGAFVHEPPAGYMSGKEQFYFKVDIEHKIDNNSSLILGWSHLSNGAGLGIGNWPNYGLDAYYFIVQKSFEIFPH